MHILSKNTAVGLVQLLHLSNSFNWKKNTNFITRILIPLGDLVTP